MKEGAGPAEAWPVHITKRAEPTVMASHPWKGFRTFLRSTKPGLQVTKHTDQKPLLTGLGLPRPYPRFGQLSPSPSRTEETAASSP